MKVTYIYDRQRTAIRRHVDAKDVFEQWEEDLQTRSSHEAPDEGFWEIDGYKPKLHEPKANLHRHKWLWVCPFLD